MGIYIKGMKMPKSCYDCDLCDGTICYAIKDIHLTMRFFAHREKPDWCPLIEVPSDDVAPVPKWIPVSERLPMPHTKVLLAYKQGVTIGYLGGYPKKGEKAYFHGVHGWKHTLTSVTHWQYPPEPPKEGE